MTVRSLQARSAGLLLHPTSLPGSAHAGDIGPAARQFVEFLKRSRIGWWQMLPIHPVGGGYSPYDSPSAFAGSERLISLEDLVTDGLLRQEELSGLSREAGRARADLAGSKAAKEPLLRKAFTRFESEASAELRWAYGEFLADAASWVWDFALFTALKLKFEGKSWVEWPEELRARHHQALEAAHRELATEVAYQVFLQFCFHSQWRHLRQVAKDAGVALLGDIPMYVAHDSVDVWCNQHLFFLNERGERLVQAGVPPDYFSEDGQLWGNPLYRWERMREDGFGWWVDRLRRELQKFDAVRLDHFIALSRYWEVPMGVKNAKVGRYVEVPGYEFLETARARLGGLPMIAEDLGIVTPEVEALRDKFELPGMKVLQFAFCPGAESYLPHRHPEQAVVYTGTHDNNTTRGWLEQLEAQVKLESEAGKSARVERARVEAYVGSANSQTATSQLVRSLFASQARLAVVPVQDVLNLPEDQRMNVPGIAEGNWSYRLGEGLLTDEVAAGLRALVEVTERFG